LIYNPDELQALIGLANAKYDMGAPMQAIEYYEKAIKIDDDISDVFYNLANA
jgi:tetratricopeptide (TPR) repeat protein